MKFAGVAELQALSHANLDRSFVKIADHRTGVEIVIGHDRVKLLSFSRRRIRQRRDEYAGFAFPPQSLRV